MPEVLKSIANHPRVRRLEEASLRRKPAIEKASLVSFKSPPLFRFNSRKAVVVEHPAKPAIFHLEYPHSLITPIGDRSTNVKSYKLVAKFPNLLWISPWTRVSWTLPARIAEGE